MKTTIGLEQAILFAGAMISHLCIVIGAFVTLKRSYQTHQSEITLLRYGLIAVCCISFSWLIVVIGIVALR